MGEIASTYPTAGGLYFWASKLGSPAWGWFTGWFNLVGQIAVTAAIDYGAAIFTTSLLNLWFSGLPNTRHAIFVTFTIIIGLHLLINLLGVKLLAGLNSISAWWHMVGVAIIVAVLIIVPDHHQSASYVFTKTINNSGFSGHGWSSPVFWFVFGLGLLDGPVHDHGLRRVGAHERGDAQRVTRGGVGHRHVGRRVGDLRLRAAPRSDVRDPEHGGRPRGRGEHRHVHLAIVDEHEMGGVPARHRRRRTVLLRHGLGHVGLADDVRVLPRRRDPGPSLVAARSTAVAFPCTRSVAIAILSWALMIPTYWNNATGYLVGTSIAVIGLYIAFALPIILRWRAGESFERGPWNLGKHYKWIDALAVGWIALICVLFLMPVDAHRDPVEDGLQLERRQLRADHGRRRPAPLRRLVPAVRPQVVQGPGAAGLRGRARADRVRSRRRRRSGTQPASA